MPYKIFYHVLLLYATIIILTKNEALPQQCLGLYAVRMVMEVITG